MCIQVPGVSAGTWDVAAAGKPYSLAQGPYGTLFVLCWQTPPSNGPVKAVQLSESIGEGSHVPSRHLHSFDADTLMISHGPGEAVQRRTSISERMQNRCGPERHAADMHACSAPVVKAC